ncbi:DUF5703 domain-containing protein [Maribellus mangrovi]|uniref:DUF5703 domain-containing protein n=1 Tax=Maribellus mangrovi TaxID=3133146 RepID=UPI0030EE672F
MKYLYLLIVFTGLLISSCSRPENVSKVEQYNVLWTSPSQNAGESMPLVGGDIGCNLWVENGDLMLYVQRSGSLSENGEYLKMGRFRITLNPNPFTDENAFRQELKLNDGYIEIESESGGQQLALIKLWIDVFSPVVHIDVESSHKTEVNVAYESWRTEDTELAKKENGRNERFTCFSLDGYPGKVVRVKDETAHLGDGVLFYHRNPADKLIPDVLIKQQGLEEYKDEIFDDIKNRTFGGYVFGEGLVPDDKGEGTYLNTPFKSWSLKSENARRKHSISIATHIEQADSREDWQTHLFETVEQTNSEAQLAFEKTKKWWNDFWQRSYIIIDPDDPAPEDSIWQMGRNYQLFRYQLGGNVSGEYPTKFNGGNLIYDPVLMGDQYRYDPDWRQWGGAVHTAQNQRLLYWPLLKSGDFDVIVPQFELYRKGLPAAKARVEKYFGHEGAVFSEYMNAPGLVLGMGWGWDKTGHRGRGAEIPFGDPRANANTGYNTTVEEGILANPYISYHWESQLEHAYMIMEYHRFSGADISRYMPFIKESVVFFDQHYQLRQKMRSGKPLDENGKLVFYPSTSCETFRGATNPIDLIAGLKACLQSLIKLDETYLTKEEKTYYEGYLTRIPDYPLGEENGLKYFKPAESWMSVMNVELPQFYPLFPFNQFHIGDAEIEFFRNAYELAPDYKGMVKSWHQEGIQFARMGMTEEAAAYNTQKLKDSPRRFPTFWGPGHDWVPDHNWGGSGMIGLQEMLMQTIGDQILLLPAWPKNWDVDFKLHAPKNTTVEVVYRNGKLEKLKVQPEERIKDVVFIDSSINP